jgi:hypothetical protein
MYNGHKKPKQPRSDDYDTSISAYKMIEPFVPKGITLYDPFYNTGSCAEKMREVFDCKVIHEDKDAFSWFPTDVDMIITNPPFSIKYKVLEWLMEKDLPFMCLLPFNTLTTIKYSNVPNYDKIQYITSTTRIQYDRPNINSNSNFESAWFCYKINLPKDLLIVPRKK